MNTTLDIELVFTIESGDDSGTVEAMATIAMRTKLHGAVTTQWRSEQRGESRELHIRFKESSVGHDVYDDVITVLDTVTELVNKARSAWGRNPL